MKYGELNLGQIEAIVNKLGGMESVGQFLRGELVVKAVERAFKVWRTIKLGTGPTTADDFRKALKASGCRISDWVNDILGRLAFTASSKEQELDLVVVSVAELGFKNGTARKDIYAKAQEIGLTLCPAEVGPELRLQYKDQPVGEWLYIAMEPITDSDGCLRVFRVGHGESGQWLDSYAGHPRNFWDEHSRWVFARRKPAHNATA